MANRDGREPKWMSLVLFTGVLCVHVAQVTVHKVYEQTVSVNKVELQKREVKTTKGLFSE